MVEPIRWPWCLCNFSVDSSCKTVQKEDFWEKIEFPFYPFFLFKPIRAHELWYLIVNNAVKKLDAPLNTSFFFLNIYIMSAVGLRRLTARNNLLCVECWWLSLLAQGRSFSAARLVIRRRFAEFYANFLRFLRPANKPALMLGVCNCQVVFWPPFA